MNLKSQWLKKLLNKKGRPPCVSEPHGAASHGSVKPTRGVPAILCGDVPTKTSIMHYSFGPDCRRLGGNESVGMQNAFRQSVMVC